MKWHQISSYVMKCQFHFEGYHPDVIKCHEMSFNLTWWHLMTCHDVDNLIQRGSADIYIFVTHATACPLLVLHVQSSVFTMWYSNTQQDTTCSRIFLGSVVLMFPLWTHTWVPPQLQLLSMYRGSTPASHLKMFTLQTRLTLELGHSCLIFWTRSFHLWGPNMAVCCFNSKYIVACQRGAVSDRVFQKRNFFSCQSAKLVNLALWSSKKLRFWNTLVSNEPSGQRQDTGPGIWGTLPKLGGGFLPLPLPLSIMPWVYQWQDLNILSQTYKLTFHGLTCRMQWASGKVVSWKFATLSCRVMEMNFSS